MRFVVTSEALRAKEPQSWGPHTPGASASLKIPEMGLRTLDEGPLRQRLEDDERLADLVARALRSAVESDLRAKRGDYRLLPNQTNLP